MLPLDKLQPVNGYTKNETENCWRVTTFSSAASYAENQLPTEFKTRDWITSFQIDLKHFLLACYLKSIINDNYWNLPSFLLYHCGTILFYVANGPWDTRTPIKEKLKKCTQDLCNQFQCLDPIDRKTAATRVQYVKEVYCTVSNTGHKSKKKQETITAQLTHIFTIIHGTINDHDIDIYR